jgi:hypothetical protein
LRNNLSQASSKAQNAAGEWARTAELSGRGVPSSAQRFITANIRSSICDNGKYEILCFNPDITFLSFARFAYGAFGNRKPHEDRDNLSPRSLLVFNLPPSWSHDVAGYVPRF